MSTQLMQIIKRFDVHQTTDPRLIHFFSAAAYTHWFQIVHTTDISHLDGRDPLESTPVSALDPMLGTIH